MEYYIDTSLLMSCWGDNKKNEGHVTVEFRRTHVGHTLNMTFLNLSEEKKDEKEWLVELNQVSLNVFWMIFEHQYLRQKVAVVSMLSTNETCIIL